MGFLFRYKYHLLAALILLAVLLVSRKTKVLQMTEEADDLPRIETESQVEQAFELMAYRQQNGGDLRNFILKKVKKALPKNYRTQAFEVARSIIVEANHHGLDPLFLMAVISTESSFNPKARGRHGEVGLMQLLPATARWIAPHAGVSADGVNLENPLVNIRIGATYFAQLRKRFNNNGVQYVSAYNMGAKNVKRLLASNKAPKIYSERVITNYKKIYLSVAAQSPSTSGREVASLD